MTQDLPTANRPNPAGSVSSGKARYPSEQREMALKLLEMRIEGSFATAFLEAFLRADLTNQAHLGKPFDIFAEKFGWEEKVTKWGLGK